MTVYTFAIFCNDAATVAAAYAYAVCIRAAGAPANAA